MPIEYRKYGPPTAYSFSKQVKDYGDGSVLLQVWRWNCWGEPRGGPGASYKVRVAGKQIKIGWTNYITIELLKKGCCPPMLKQETVGEQDLPLRTGGAAEEAMKLHKRGYLGGRG